MTGPNEYFSQHAKEYSNSKSHASGSDLKLLLRMLSGKEYPRALDIATGTGFTAIGIAEFCENVVGIDPTPEMLEEARKNSSKSSFSDRISFTDGTAESTGFPDSSFDLVTCRRAAHHFTDKAAFLKEAKRVLKDIGRIAIVDFVTPEDDQDMLLDELERIRDPTHVHAASESEWRRLVESAGLRVLELEKDRDERAFDDWLYPVAENSPEGVRCAAFVKTNVEKLSKTGTWNPSAKKVLKVKIVMIAGM